MSRVLLRGGRIYTKPATVATAMHCVDGSITWIGSDVDAVRYLDQSDEVIDLEGSLVTPAFVDAHVHTTAAGLALTGLDLTETTSLGQMLDALERYCRRERGHRVLGHGWDETRWPDARPPTRHELDRASYGGFVYLTRIDVHSAVASSALLAALPDIRTVEGYSESGLLHREAHHLARAAALRTIPAAQRDAAQRATLDRAAHLGIGALHELGGPDISGADDFKSVLAVAASGAFPDVVGYWGQLGGQTDAEGDAAAAQDVAPEGVRAAQALGARGAAGDLFADGALGSHTACLRAAYADEPHRGVGYLTADQVRDHVVACTRAGIQAGFHVIGDGALDSVIDGFTMASQRVGAKAIRSARHRLEHVEMVDDRHLRALADLGIVASVQPAFDALWGGDAGMYVTRLGHTRAATMNPFASMQAAGVVLAFGSDAPVTPLDPWAGVRAAVMHQTERERIDTESAFAAHTSGGWKAAGVDDQGVLAPGRPATYAVWSAPESVETTTGLPDLREGAPAPTCQRTVVAGQTIFAGEEALR